MTQREGGGGVDLVSNLRRAEASQAKQLCRHVAQQQKRHSKSLFSLSGYLNET
jgi:hypothetical protein